MIRECTQADIDYVAANMRDADTLECTANGLNPIDALAMSVRNSNQYKTFCIKDIVIAIFGICPDPDDKGNGIIWLLGTEHIKKHSKSFLKSSKKEFMSIMSNYKTATNLIHKDNDLHLRWVKWLGFEVDYYNDRFNMIKYTKENI